MEKADMEELLVQTIALRARVGADGILHLEVPVALTNTELDVKLTMEPVKEETDSPEGRGWPPGFFEETFGSCQDDPLIIDFEGEFEAREALL